MKGKIEPTLTEQIATTADLLKQLKAEQADINNKMRLAVNDADSAAMIQLRRRADDLPYEITGSEIRLERLRHQADEQLLAELEPERERLYPAVGKARQVFDEAQRQLNIATAAHLNAIDAVNEQRRVIGRHKRRVEMLIQECGKPIGNARQAAS